MMLWLCADEIAYVQSETHNQWSMSDISNQWGCKGEVVVLMDVRDSHKEIIVCQDWNIWNLMLLNCSTGRRLIYIITQFMCWIKYF